MLDKSIGRGLVELGSSRGFNTGGGGFGLFDLLKVLFYPRQLPKDGVLAGFNAVES